MDTCWVLSAGEGPFYLDEVLEPFADAARRGETTSSTDN